MSPLTKLSRILAPVFSLSLLAGYVSYTHLTTKQRSSISDESVSFSSAKSISRPVFSMKQTTEGVGVSEAANVPDVFLRSFIPGSKSGPVDFFRIHPWELLGFRGYEIDLDPFPSFQPKPMPLIPFPDWITKSRAEMQHDPFRSNGPPEDPFAALPEKPLQSP